MESIKNWWNSPGASFTDPRVQALFGASSALMEAGRPGTRNSLGSAMGQGLQGAMGGYNQGLQNQYMQILTRQHGAQAGENEIELARKKGILDTTNKLFGIGTQKVPNVNSASTNAGVNTQTNNSSLENHTLGNEITSSDSRKYGHPFDHPDSLQTIQQLHAMGGPNFYDQWRDYHLGREVTAGSTLQNSRTGEMIQVPKATEGMLHDYKNKSTSVIPGILQSFRDMNATKALGTGEGNAATNIEKVINPDGSESWNTRSNVISNINKGTPQKAGLSPGVAKYAEIDAKAGAERYNELQNASLNAPATIAKYRQLGTLLSQHEGGSLSKMGLNIASLANSMGIKIDKNLPNKQAAEALSNELALSMRDPSQGMGMPGAMSDADRDYLVDATPNLSQSLAGRTKLIDMKISVLERSQDVAKMSSKWVKRYGGLHGRDESGLSFQDHLAEWSDRNRLFAPKE